MNNFFYCFWLAIIVLLSPATYSQTGPEQPLKVDMRWDRKEKLDGVYYLYLNHSATLWDRKAETKMATIELVDLIDREHPEFKKILALDFDGMMYLADREKYYVDEKGVDYTLFSLGGAHQLEFSEARVFAFAGGNLSMCLCEAIRDSVRGSAKRKKTIDILLPADAIYDREDATSKEWPKLGKSWGETFSLQRMFADLTDIQISLYIKNQVIGKKSWCQWQDTGKHPLQSDDYKVNLYRGDKIIGTFGQGNKVVNITFTDVAHFSQTLSDVETRSLENESRTAHPSMELNPATMQSNTFNIAK